MEEHIDLNEIEKNYLKDCFRISYYPKDSYYIKEGSNTRKIGFVVKGAAINTHMINDIQSINRFYLEHSFICNLHSFLTQTDADSDILFTETSVVLELDYLAYINMKKDFPKIYDFIFSLQNDELQFCKQRISSLQLKSAKIRLEELISQNHNILGKFKMKYIADYLGMEQCTLSRIYKQVKKFDNVKNFIINKAN